MHSPFEAIMLLCFGASWPFSVYKTWKIKNAQGKSLRFMVLVLVGYASGIVHKIVYSPDAVIYLYVLNMVVVSVDLVLCLRYRNGAPGLGAGQPSLRPAAASGPQGPAAPSGGTQLR
jgi:hypothetical protein